MQNGTDQLKLNYSYGTWEGGAINTQKNNGNIAQQIITVPTVGQTQGFAATQNYYYDSLNRIQQVTETIPNQTGWQQTFQYDRFGNRRFDAANTTTLAPSCAEAVCNPQINPANNRLISYQFDNTGNSTQDAENRTFIYDAEDKQIEVRNSQNQIIGQYFYDGDGKRVKKYVPSTGETTIFVYDASGKLVAEYSTIIASPEIAKVSYLTNDNLGSPRINTDANGNVTARHDYQPFGEEIARTSYGADSIRKKFTSYERDNEISLDFAQARYYNTSHGRFTSVDPIMMEKKRLADPQAINLYVYTRNNPLKYIDPDGEKFKGTDGKEVIIKREKVNGKKQWVIKSNNASNDLKKLVGLVNNSGSRTANNMFSKLNKHATMINLVIDTTTSLTSAERAGASVTIGLHQPHDKNGALNFNDSTDRFDGKAEPAVDDKGNVVEGAYKEATITLFEKRIEELQGLGRIKTPLDDTLVSVFGHEARHDLDPIQVQAGITGTGSNAIWHPEKNGKPKKESPDYFEAKILKQIEESRRKNP